MHDTAPPVPAAYTDSGGRADVNGRDPEGAGGDEDAARLRVWEHLADLAERLDPDSFQLFLKVLSGVNEAFARRDRRVEIKLSPQDMELYTPQLQRELTALMEKASFPANRIVAEIVPVSAGSEQRGAVARAHEREA